MLPDCVRKDFKGGNNGILKNWWKINLVWLQKFPIDFSNQSDIDINESPPLHLLRHKGEIKLFWGVENKQTCC